jgi:hypothetical protein
VVRLTAGGRGLVTQWSTIGPPYTPTSQIVSFGDDGLSVAAIGFLDSDRRRKRIAPPQLVVCEEAKQRAIPLDAVYAAVRGGLLEPDSVRRLAANAGRATAGAPPSHPPQRIAVGRATNDDVSDSDLDNLPYMMAADRVRYGEALLSEVAIGFRKRDRRRPLVPQLVVRVGRRQRAVTIEAVWAIMGEGLVSADSMRVLADEGEQRRQEQAEREPKATSP